MQLGTPYPLTMVETEPLAFYATPGPLTDPGPHAALFDRLPPNVAALVEIVQGVLLPVWANLDGDDRRADLDLRAVADMLSRLQILSPGPLTAPRTPEERLLAHSRHFATLLTALLRDQGLPARVRSGFVTYLNPAAYEDHWVCEYWDTASARWVTVDAQLDAQQCRALRIEFDPLDIPAGRFLPAGRAWKRVRHGHVDPGHAATAETRGSDAIQGNLLHDLAALNKVELLPDDRWGLSERPYATLSPAELGLLDRIADLTLAGNDAFLSLRRVYTADDRLTVPADLITGSPAAFHPIAA